MQPRTRILIVEDHAMVREGLKFILQPAHDLEVCADVDSGNAALAALASLQIDVVLLDIGLGQDNGLELIKTIRARAPSTQVLVVSSYSESDYAVQALTNGAAGFVSKGATPSTLLSAIRQVSAGKRYLSAETAAQLAGSVRNKAQNRSDVLSGRELQILRGLAAGQAQTALAAELGISIKTVNTYRARILLKTNCTSNADLVRYAMRNGLVAG